MDVTKEVRYDLLIYCFLYFLFVAASSLRAISHKLFRWMHVKVIFRWWWLRSRQEVDYHIWRCVHTPYPHNVLLPPFQFAWMHTRVRYKDFVTVGFFSLRNPQPPSLSLPSSPSLSSSLSFPPFLPFPKHATVVGVPGKFLINERPTLAETYILLHEKIWARQLRSSSPNTLSNHERSILKMSAVF